jgi:sugar phosphate isomerase/epimerase
MELLGLFKCNRKGACMDIGAQLYTLRDYEKTLADFSETLKKVAEIGYRKVQVSGTCAYEPKWLREQLDSNGLECVITHIPSERIKNDTEKVIADHKVIGCRYIGIGCAPNCFENGEKDYDELCTIIEAAGLKLYDNGCQLMYHNHHYEFEKRITVSSFLKIFSKDFLATSLKSRSIPTGCRLAERMYAILLKNFPAGFPAFILRIWLL